MRQSETPAAALNDSPAFVDRAGRFDGVLQLADGEVCVQDAPEDAAENNAASAIEFLISKILDGQPDDDAEGDQYQPAAAGAGGEQDRQAGEKAGRSIEYVGNATGRETAGKQAVMDVSTVCAENVLLAKKTARDSKAGIEEGDGKSDQRRGHPEESSGFLRPNDGETAEEKADSIAATIAHKYGGGAEVVVQEPEEGAEEGSCDKGERVIAGEQGTEKSRGGGEQADTGREAVDAIDQIKGVGTADEPENGERDLPPIAAEGIAGEPAYLDTGNTNEDCGENLANDLHPGLQVDQIVEETGGEGH